jgi:hypothetical protein
MFIPRNQSLRRNRGGPEPTLGFHVETLPGVLPRVNRREKNNSGRVIGTRQSWPVERQAVKGAGPVCSEKNQLEWPLRKRHPSERHI